MYNKKNIFTFLLISLISLPVLASSVYDCCEKHGGVSNCFMGNLICADGKTSRCNCKNKILDNISFSYDESMIEDYSIEKAEEPKKNFFGRLFKKKNNTSKEIPENIQSQ